MKITVEHLKTVCTALLKALGATPREAEIVSENLVLSEMRGIKTHGLNFLPKIAMRIEHNQLNVPTILKTATNIIRPRIIGIGSFCSSIHVKIFWCCLKIVLM